MIKGCANVQVESIGAGGSTGMASASSCLLNGRAVDVNTWSSADAEAGVEAVLKASHVEAYFAQGTGWTVTTHDDGTLHMQLTNDAGGLLAQSLGSPSAPTTAADIPGQKDAAEAAVASLGGEVVHVAP